MKRETSYAAFKRICITPAKTEKDCQFADIKLDVLFRNGVFTINQLQRLDYLIFKKRFELGLI